MLCTHPCDLLSNKLLHCSLFDTRPTRSHVWAAWKCRWWLQIRPVLEWLRAAGTPRVGARTEPVGEFAVPVDGLLQPVGGVTQLTIAVQLGEPIPTSRLHRQCDANLEEV